MHVFELASEQTDVRLQIYALLVCNFQIMLGHKFGHEFVVLLGLGKFDLLQFFFMNFTGLQHGLQLTSLSSYTILFCFFFQFIINFLLQIMRIAWTRLEQFNAAFLIHVNILKFPNLFLGWILTIILICWNVNSF